MGAAIAGGTKIEWADFTFNPWHGCEKVSPGCAHCYAEGQSARFNGAGLWGAGHGFRFQSDAYWSEPLAWARKAPAKLGRRPRVFCASMADIFEEHPDLIEPRARLFALIMATPELDWLVLTKRPEFARDTLARNGFWEYVGIVAGKHYPTLRWNHEYELRRKLPNLWLGVSIENSRFTWRADVLREIPAAVRFISAEPLLGSLYPAGLDESLIRGTRVSARAPLDLAGISWVIVGGESGHGARPMRIEWARELVDACYQQSDTEGDSLTPAVFVKQLGTRLARELGAQGKGGAWDDLPADLRIREFPRSAAG